MTPYRNFTRKVIKNLGKVVVSKRYDYIANYKNGEYLVFRRLYEDKPWELVIRIPEDKLDTTVGYWKYTEAGKRNIYREDPKHGNRYIRINDD